MDEEQEDLQTLESEIKDFCKEFPYWKKYLAEVILSGEEVKEEHIQKCLTFLKEDLDLLPLGDNRPNLSLDDVNVSIGDYKDDLVFEKLSQVEGVNALAENQTIEFNQNLTILFGVNGSGKSSYSRLLKNIFYSKTQAHILPNIYDETPKPVSAKLSFKEADSSDEVNYVDGNTDKRFEQFSVFDGNSVSEQLQKKHGFNFRPASLSFFSILIDAVREVQEEFSSEIRLKQAETPQLSDLLSPMVGESKIKEELSGIQPEMDFEAVKRFALFKEENSEDFEALLKEVEELKIQYASKEKTIQEKEKLIEQLNVVKSSYENLNTYISEDTIGKYNALISDVLSKNELARNEGINQFSNEKLDGIGSDEWKQFIHAADVFSQTQNRDYPNSEDTCLLCHQPLSEEADALIKSYWKFLKSRAESEARLINNSLEEAITKLEKRNLELFAEDSVLTIWLSENKSNWLDSHKSNLKVVEGIFDEIKLGLKQKSEISIDSTELDINSITHLIIEIESSIQALRSDEQSKKIEDLSTKITEYQHQKVFSRQEEHFKKYLENTGWLLKASYADFNSRNISMKERELSEKYFNPDYVKLFNGECEALNGNFGVVVNHSTSSGESKRELKLQGNSPDAVLSEGEQKVIGLADFLAEMTLSSINKGIVFDDPVNSLDDKRKRDIAKRLVELAKAKQIIVFTHDLVFTSELFDECEASGVEKVTHWVERGEHFSGLIRPQNTPAIDAEYKTSAIAKKLLQLAKDSEDSPEMREMYLKNGFSALRTSYETLVIYDLFQSSVLRFKDRVSVDAIKNVPFCSELRDEVLSNFGHLCRHMEGHSHSAEYGYIQPSLDNLQEEITKYETLRSKIRGTASRIKDKKLELGQVYVPQG